MQSFIAQTWEYLSSQCHDTSQLRCIVPSVRAGNFLRQIIRQESNTAGFLPDIIPIEAFIQEVADLQIIDELPLLFECYQVYRYHEPKQPKEDFDTFSSWAVTLLADFNEIDRYLVPAKSFFDYLASIQELNHWTMQEAPSEMMRAYLSFWNQLHGYYDLLKSALMKKKLGYQGMVYREATHQVNFYLDAKGDRPHAFIGFNALNNAEQNIFQEFLARDNHYVFWDGDEKFINDTGHSASLFMRRYFKQWQYYEKHKPLFIENHYQQPKDITLIQAANPLDQVKEIGSILKGFSPEQCQKTAVVLADEQLLMPLLNALPDNIKHVNITMGVSLKFQPLTIWVISLLELHLNSGRSFYYKPLFGVLEHPMAEIIMNKPRQVVSEMTQTNRVAIDLPELLEKSDDADQEILKTLFSDWPKDIDQALDRLEELFGLFVEVENDIHRTTAVKLQQLIVQIRNMQARYGSITDLESLRNVLRQLAGKARLDFQGDAYQGLQIMGVLESRALDFESLIIASVNEGLLPSGRNAPSFITNDMKLQYQLPTFFEKDAIFTYHFYRMLHRAKEVKILFTSVGGGFQSKEESRLIKQLRLDSKAHKLKERTIRTKMAAKTPQLKVVDKTPEVMHALKQLAQNQYSPSSLTNYIRNPIDFYSQKVLGVKPADELEEDIALNTLGSVVHTTLEELYTPLVGTLLTEEKLRPLLKEINSTLTQQSLKLLGKHYDLGKNRIVFEVGQRYVKYAIESDLRLLRAGHELELVAIEQRLKTQLNHPKAGVVNLGGLADRIDRLDGKLRIIDYKTGKVEPNQLQLSDWDVLIEDYKYSKAFQVLMYGYMYWKQHGVLADAAGIISFRKQTEDFMAFGWKQQGSRTVEAQLNQDILLQFEKQLLQLFDEIYDEHRPFIEKEI